MVIVALSLLGERYQTTSRNQTMQKLVCAFYYYSVSNEVDFIELLIKTDSAQSSSNKCKNFLLKILSLHINFLNTI